MSDEQYVKVIIRDGRAGRDRAEDTEDGGPILDEYENPEKLPDIGDRLTLPTGEEVEVIGVNDAITMDKGITTAYTLTAFVGDVWDTD